MTTINLREYYPEYYKADCMIEVPDEVAAAFPEFNREEKSYQMRNYCHKAYYSLDQEDGIECSALSTVLTPDEIYEQKAATQELYTAIAGLPDKQARRVYARYILGMSQTDIAKAEGVSKMAVNYSIEHNLASLKKFFEKNGLCDFTKGSKM